MKTGKMLDRIRSFMDADQRAQIKQADAIKEILHKLKKKERHLKEKLENCKNSKEAEKLKVKVAVCHAQRKKGLAKLKEIRAGQ